MYVQRSEREVPITISNIVDLPAALNVTTHHVVSILDPGNPAPECLTHFAPKRILSMRFHDVAENGRNLIAPSDTHVMQLIEFANLIDHNCDHVLVHCRAGLSRSPAAAIILCLRLNSASPEEALSMVLRSAPNAWPNPRLIALGDRLLQCGGALVHAVDVHRAALRLRFPLLGQILTEAQSNSM